MEIDTNIQIIQLVHSRPVLYSKCNDFRGRSQQWKEVADILKVDVVWVKSRWHILRARFLKEYASELKGKPTKFKYFNEMGFLINHVNVQAFEMHLKQEKQKTHPEFLISKEDLKDVSDDDSTTIFMELDLDESANKDLIQIPQTFDLTGEISEGELDETLYMSNEEFSQHPQLIKPSKYKLDPDPQLETFHIVEVTEKEDTATVVLKEKTKENVEESNDDVKLVPDEHEQNSVQEEQCVQEQQDCEELDTSMPEEFDANKLCSEKPEKHRCEDTIFGELVTATLRKMQSEKKKSVKREIMNILFT